MSKLLGLIKAQNLYLQSVFYFIVIEYNQAMQMIIQDEASLTWQGSVCF
jgi:hypothetical protein